MTAPKSKPMTNTTEAALRDALAPFAAGPCTCGEVYRAAGVKVCATCKARAALSQPSPVPATAGEAIPADVVAQMIADAISTTEARLALSQPSPASSTAGEALTCDIRRLVIAARRVSEAESWASHDKERRERMRTLDQATEAFAAAVPWDDEPLSPSSGEPDHIADDSSEIVDRSEKVVGAVLEVAQSPVAVGAEKTANDQTVVTMIDMEVGRVSTRPVRFANSALAALRGQHLLILVGCDAATGDQAVFTGLPALPVLDHGSANSVRVPMVPLDGRSIIAFITTPPQDDFARSLQGELVSGEGLLALAACPEFHSTIIAPMFGNGQSGKMVRPASVAVEAEAYWRHKAQQADWIAAQRAAPSKPTPASVAVGAEVRHLAAILEEWDMKDPPNEFTGHAYEDIARDALTRLALPKPTPVQAGLREALERLHRNFHLLLAGKPVRDVAETDAEVLAALATPQSQEGS